MFQNYFSLSSCSGRIVVFAEGGTREEAADHSAVDLQDTFAERGKREEPADQSTVDSQDTFAEDSEEGLDKIEAEDNTDTVATKIVKIVKVRCQ